MGGSRVLAGAVALAADVDEREPGGDRADAPLVCLHAGICDRRMWRPLAAALGERARVFAYDRPGFGETPAVDAPRPAVDDLRSVLEDARVGAPAVLVGCSQGGRIAIDLALRWPELVRALVLVAPAISGAPEPELPHAVQVLADAIGEAERAADLERVNALEIRLWLDGPLAPEGRVGDPLRSLVLDMNRIALAACAMPSAREPPAAWDRLGEIGAPTLVLWGDLDLPHVQANCRRLIERIGGATWVIVEGTAHLPTLERPQICAERVADFLERVRSRAD